MTESAPMELVFTMEAATPVRCEPSPKNPEAVIEEPLVTVVVPSAMLLPPT